MHVEAARQQLLALYQSALDAIGGRQAVARALRDSSPSFNPETTIEANANEPRYLVAVGKAAQAMLLGAIDAQPESNWVALLITKYGHVDHVELERAQAAADTAGGSLQLEVVEAAHPVPDKNSLQAGARLHAFLSAAPEQSEWLMLVSGGASALVEALPDGMSLAQLAELNQWLLASGLAINEINQIRQGLSRCKAGQWLPLARAKAIRVLLVSDVQGDNPQRIGSGLFVPNSEAPPVEQALIQKMPQSLQQFWSPPLDATTELAECAYSVEVVASLDIALTAVVESASAAAVAVNNHGASLFGDVDSAAEQVLAEVEAAPGLHIWGGELTPQLPANPGRGGRCQQMALALASRIENRPDLVVMVVSTDGGDGNSDAAGALVDGGTLSRAATLDAAEYLAAANSEAFLAESGDLIHTGPTGSNVTDLTMVWRQHR